MNFDSHTSHTHIHTHTHSHTTCSGRDYDRGNPGSVTSRARSFSYKLKGVCSERRRSQRQAVLHEPPLQSKGVGVKDERCTRRPSPKNPSTLETFLGSTKLDMTRNGEISDQEYQEACGGGGAELDAKPSTSREGAWEPGRRERWHAAAGRRDRRHAGRRGIRNEHGDGANGDIQGADRDGRSRKPRKPSTLHDINT